MHTGVTREHDQLTLNEKFFLITVTMLLTSLTHAQTREELSPEAFMHY